MAEEKPDKHDPKKNPLYHKALNSPWRRVLMIATIVVIVAGAGGAGYWYLVRPKLNSPDKTPTASADSNSSATATITAATKKYVSQSFGLEFAYPENWTATEDNNQEIKVLSPDIQLKSASGQKTNGQILMTIQSKSVKLPGFDKGNAVATRDSKKIAYAKPSQTQRAETYISFLRYVGSTGGLDGVYITGDFGYLKDQAIPQIDVEKIDPIIKISFSQCPAKGCVELGTPMSIQTQMWDEQSFSAPLEKMLKSFAIN